MCQVLFLAGTIVRDSFILIMGVETVQNLSSNFTEGSFAVVISVTLQCYPFDEQFCSEFYLFYT